MRPMVLILALLGLDMCDRDDSAAGYGPADRVWRLTEIDGAAFPARATLNFPEPGRIAGEAPCNRYSGAMEASYPAFSAAQVAATRRACPDLAAETDFLAALATMTRAEATSDVLILRDGAGREMRFTAGE